MLVITYSLYESDSPRQAVFIQQQIRLDEILRAVFIDGKTESNQRGARKLHPHQTRGARRRS